MNIILIIIVAVISLIASSGSGRTGTRNTRKRDFSDTSQQGFDFGAGAEELRKWMSGQRFKEDPYRQDEYISESAEEYTAEPTQPESQRWGSLGEDNTEGNEIHDYSHSVEQMYTERGMSGDMEEGVDSRSDVQQVQRAAPRQDTIETEQQRLLSALNDLPAAIVAAEVIGPPKALRHLGRR